MLFFLQTAPRPFYLRKKSEKTRLLIEALKTHQTPRVNPSGTCVPICNWMTSVSWVFGVLLLRVWNYVIVTREPKERESYWDTVLLLFKWRVGNTWRQLDTPQHTQITPPAVSRESRPNTPTHTNMLACSYTYTPHTQTEACNATSRNAINTHACVCNMLFSPHPHLLCKARFLLYVHSVIHISN